MILMVTYFNMVTYFTLILIDVPRKVRRGLQCSIRIRMVHSGNERGKESDFLVGSHEQTALYYSWKNVTYDNGHVL